MYHWCLLMTWPLIEVGGWIMKKTLWSDSAKCCKNNQTVHQSANGFISESCKAIQVSKVPDMECSSNANGVTWARPSWAAFCVHKCKTEYKTTHKQAATEGGWNQCKASQRRKTWCPWVQDFRQSLQFLFYLKQSSVHANPQVKPLELKSKELEKDSDWTYYSFSKMPHLSSTRLLLFKGLDYHDFDDWEHTQTLELKLWVCTSITY